MTRSAFSVASIRSRSRVIAAPRASVITSTASESRSQPSAGAGSEKTLAIVPGRPSGGTPMAGALRHRVRVRARGRDHLVQLEVDRAEPRAHDVPVRLLADQGQAEQVDQGVLEGLAGDPAGLVGKCAPHDGHEVVFLPVDALVAPLLRSWRG